MTKKKSRRRKRSRKILWLIAGIMGAIAFGMAVYMLILAKTGSNLTKPDELLITYMNYISEQNYKGIKCLTWMPPDRSGRRIL